MQNIPVVKLGLVAVSRDCFPIALSEKRRAAIAEKCGQKKLDIVEIKTTVENEKDMLKAVEELKANECNAAVVFLGNFGPETPETLIAKNFDGPCMVCGSGGRRRRHDQRSRRRLLRYAELLLQSGYAPPEGLHPGISHRHGG